MMIILFLLKLFVCVNSDNGSNLSGKNIHITEESDILIHNKLLILYTFDGFLYGVEKFTGKIRWKVIYEINQINSYYMRNNLFFASPLDGTVYYHDDSIKSLKEKIPELLNRTPFVLKDKYIVFGNKYDSLMQLNPDNGDFRPYYYSDINKNSKNWIAIPKQEYHLSFIDIETKKHVTNLSYIHITSFLNNKKDYNDITIISDVSNGAIFALAPYSGEVMWKIQLDSTLVQAFSWNGMMSDNANLNHLSSIKLTFMSSEALDFLIKNQNIHYNEPTDFILKQGIFIGKNQHEVYFALPCYVINNQIMLESPNNYLPTTKPHGCCYDDFEKDEETSMVRSTGFYVFEPLHSRPLLPSEESNMNINSFFWSNTTVAFAISIFIYIYIALVVVMYIYFEHKFKMFNQTPYASLNSSSKVSSMNQSNTSFIANDANNELNITIGKITFCTDDLIGKGCEGTTVYKGYFEKRQVAVKRILSDFCMFADREVELLSHSDYHPNVIRYYCMEADKQFRYLALELCDITLYQYINDRYSEIECSDIIKILRQAAQGLLHIHSLNIVHRDIKPHNILLKSANCQLQVVVSDFGLCKMIPNGRSSLSICNGSVGTEGWMAPEILNMDQKITTTCDIFSFGCVIYYCLSGGNHLFGNSTIRQSNIMENNYSFGNLDHINEIITVELIDLVSSMIQTIPTLRPSMTNVLKHPLFWTFEHRSIFLQEVSDRIEREQSDSSTLLGCLQNGDFVNSYIVVRGDWRLHVHPSLLFDLGKRRRYNGHSVKDLLRAIRNKRHHFSEISPTTLESICAKCPDDVVLHFVKKFPKLTIFVYRALEKHQLDDDPLLKKFY